MIPLEGIGDEVVIFTFTITAILLGTIAWYFIPSLYQRRTLPTNVQDASEPTTTEVLVQSTSLSSTSSLNSSVHNEGLANNSAQKSTGDCITNKESTSSDLEENSSHADCSTSLNERAAKTVSNDAEQIRQQRMQYFERRRSSSTASDLRTFDEEINEINSDSNEANAETTNVESAPPNPMATSIPENAFRIRLKYLNDTERLVYAIRTEEVKDFKRRNFPEDVENNRVIHLIYNGQVLRPDNRRMSTFDLAEDCVVHVHIAQGAPQQETASASTDNDLEVGHIMWPLLACILGIVWMLYFQCRELFTPASSGVLIGLTGFFITFVWNHYGHQQR